MTIMVEREIEQDGSIPHLLDDIDVPQGWRVEFVEGNIRVVPPASVSHNIIANAIIRRLGVHFDAIGLPYQAYTDIGYCVAAGCSDKQKGNHVIPDVSVATRAFTDGEIAAADAHSNWISSAALDLVVEVTSHNRTADTRDKVAAYGRMSIPHYLLVDRRDQVAVLLTKPTGDVDSPGYADSRTFPFGTDVQLPAPYPVLETKTWQ